MPTAENDFLPFATGAGANVLTTEEWNALAAVGSGFQSGILPSTNLNKALRQSSFVACAMAQIIAGQDVAATDDGNVANFVTNFLAALVTALGTVASFTNPGYLILPGGFVIQWGNATITAPANTNQALTFPLEFPTACFEVFGSSASVNTYAGANSGTRTGCNLFAGNTSAVVSWFAIGH
jgi:hypothetical protein